MNLLRKIEDYRKGRDTVFNKNKIADLFRSLYSLLQTKADADAIPAEAPEDGKTYGRKDASWNDLAAVSVSGSYDDLGDTPDLSEKQDNYTTESITIAVSDWSVLTATKTVPGVTATSFNSICADKENSDLLGAFGVAGDSQDTDEITFKADETPTSDISLTIVIFS
jgi:hypothetical protein